MLNQIFILMSNDREIFEGFCNGMIFFSNYIYYRINKCNEFIFKQFI